MTLSDASRVARAKTFLDLFLLALLCLALFGWRLGHLPLIDPDEPFYALTSREMLGAHDWVVPRIFGHPQFEKPPMVYWLVMLSMRAFGQTEAAARLPAAGSAAALVLMVYAFGAKQFGRRAALTAAIVLATGLEFLIMARMLLTDMMFALFVCASCFAFWLGARDPTRRGRWWVAAALACGLAVVTKGPLGLLVPSLAAALAWIRNDAPRRVGLGTLLAGFGLFAVVAVPWYAVMTRRFGVGFLRAFFVHENWDRLIRAEHGPNDHWYYYPAVLVVGSIPWWPSLAAAIARSFDARRDPTAAFLWGWILSSLGFFTLAHSKLPTYVLFAFVPLALLAGRAISDRPDGAPFAGAARHGSRAAAVLQTLAVGGAAFVPMLAPIRGGLALMTALLGVGTILLWRDQRPAWVAATATASTVLLATLLTRGAPVIDVATSSRTAASALASALAPGEPLLCERYLVRGLTYYSGATPTVLSYYPRPYFTPHPLPVVVGAPGLRAFLREHGRTLCVIETRKWRGFVSGVPPGWIVKPLLDGKKSLFLIEPAPPPGTSPTGARPTRESQVLG